MNKLPNVELLADRVIKSTTYHKLQQIIKRNVEYKLPPKTGLSELFGDYMTRRRQPGNGETVHIDFTIPKDTQHYRKFSAQVWVQYSFGNNTMSDNFVLIGTFDIHGTFTSKLVL